MALFTSDRERRLWLWAGAVAIAIYSALGWGRPLADTLREQNLLRASFAVVVLIVVVAFLVQWRKSRPGWPEAGVALCVALVYWLSFIRIENPGERTHLIEYGVLAALIHQALIERNRNGRLVAMPAGYAVAATAVLGFLDECAQLLLPTRFFDWFDVLFNALAGFMVIAAQLALAPVQRPGWRLWFLWSLAGFVGWGWSMDPSLFGEGPRLVVDIPLFQSVATGAAVLAVVQWLLLRRYVDRAWQWIPASLVAPVLGVLIVLVAGSWDADRGLAVGVASYGVLAGAAQWWVLRRHVPRAGWWIPVSAVGWLIAVPVGDIGGPPGWAIYGAITGTALVVLLRQAPAAD